MAKILLEICCGSIDDAIQSQNGGADRVELCSALFLGGLTPSIGTVQEAKRRLKIPMMVMVRPRGGGFCYSPAEFATMQRDTEAALDQGADGVVFVADSQEERIDANIESLDNLRFNLKEQGYDLDKLPYVIQYNKRDLPGAMSIEEMSRDLNPTNVPEYEACATTGEGVFETLKAIAKLILIDLKKGK